MIQDKFVSNVYSASVRTDDILASLKCLTSDPINGIGYNNLKGISRDHIFSVKSGYLLAVDPEIISHPANCRLIKQSENSSKNCKNGISLSQLLSRIETWESKYKRA